MLRVLLQKSSEPIEYWNVVDLYQKGDLICIAIRPNNSIKEDVWVERYPIDHIFRIEGDYHAAD
jgi:hypothetical protein